MLKPVSIPAPRGFSLVEVMITMAIVGIVMAVGMPSYRVWIENSKTRNAAEAVISGLSLARSEAVTRNAGVELRLAAGTSSAWEVGCTTVTLTCPAIIQVRQAVEGSSSAVTAASPSGRTFRFNNLGRLILPVPGAGTVINVDIANLNLTAADSRELRIAVDVGGSIRMCDPSVAALTDPRRC